MIDHLGLPCAGPDGQPQLWTSPVEGPGHDAVFLRHPDGSDVEAVHHRFPAS